MPKINLNKAHPKPDPNPSQTHPKFIPNPKQIYLSNKRPFTENIITATVDFNEILDTKPVCLKAALTQHETSVLFIPLKL